MKIWIWILCLHRFTAAIEWTYKEDNDYVCNFVGCCGDETHPCSPENWRYLNQDTFSRCQNRQQSPINIETGSAYSIMDETFTLENTACNGSVILKNNTWQINFADTACTMNFLNTTWSLVNLHIHNAEHTINGEYLPLEMHYVHANIYNDDLFVISLLVSGSNKDMIEPVIELFKDNNNLTDISPYSLIDEDPSFYYYQGSLTVPPCQNTDRSIVHWIILKQFLEISHHQIQYFTDYLEHISRSYYGRVNRPIQDILLDTTVYEYTNLL